MGGSSSQQGTQAQTQNQTQTQQTSPYAPAAPVVNSILANLSQSPGYAQTIGAQNQLAQIGAAGDPYGTQRAGVANTLLGGGPDRSGTANAAYSGYLGATDPFQNMANLNPYNTPGFNDALSTLNSDISSQINGQFAGAGRDLSGLNTQTLARGLSQGEGQLLANQYNQNVQNYLNTAQGRLSAGQQQTGILSNLDQVRAAFMQSGMSAADAANAASVWGPTIVAQSGLLPLNYLGAQAGIAGPLASGFGTTTGTGTGQNTGTTNQTSQMSGAQQFGLIAGGLGRLFGGGTGIPGTLPPG